MSLETISADDQVSLNDCIENLNFNSDGLIPVITQCIETKTVLMHAWMNREAVKRTISTKKMTYWSRSRQAFWVKGESSGHTQALVNMRFDCDGDTILCLVKQVGPACHTGRPNCFYLQVDGENNIVEEYLAKP